MLDILAITGPIYCTILLGLLGIRMQWFTKSDMRVFGKFVVNLALPALLFSALAQRDVSEILNASYLLAYASGTLLVAGLGWLWCRHRGLATTDSAVTLMGMVCSNSSFVGYPILLLTLAPVAAVALALNTIVENILIIPLLLALAERGREGSLRGVAALVPTLRRLAGNPMIIGMVAGLCVALGGWQLPQPLLRTVNLFAATCGALSLFVMGGALYGLPLRGMVARVAPISAAKLLLHPLGVLWACLALPALGLPALSPSMRHAAVLLAAMPTMGIYAILSQPYGLEERSAASQLLTTMCSFFSLSGLLWLLS